MTTKQQLTDDMLIDLLEKQRCTFTDQYCPLRTAQETALQKANSLAEEPLESLKRNYSKKKTNAILNDLKNCISPEVFVLCALATNPSALGTAKLGDYVSTIGCWWEKAYHPKGLTIVSERYGMRISKTPALVRGIYQDTLEDGQPANQSYPENQALIDDSPDNHLTTHSVVERPRKRKRALIDNAYPEHVPGATDSLGPERSEAPMCGRLLEAPLKSDEEARQNSTTSPVISSSCTSTPPKETQSEPTAVLKISSNRPNFTGAQEQRVIENASLQGIAKVFDEHMCGKIRRVTVQGDLKAAVTTVLPVWGGPVDCLVSLDVCERDVEQLAMALFSAKVKWVGQVLHVVTMEGITVIIPHSEATLKGVLEEAIIEVFGPEIHDAITENPVRRRELQEGKRKTECVSMIITKNGAIINLSLGLKGGLQVRHTDQFPCLLLPFAIFLIDSNITSLPVYHPTPPCDHCSDVASDILPIYCRIEYFSFKSLTAC